MRILVVSYSFPPFNVMGAVRMGHTAAWLARMGHDVAVLTAQDQPLPATLTVDLSSVEVTATQWVDFFSLLRRAGAQRASAHSRSPGASTLRGRLSSQSAKLIRGALSTVIAFPDQEIGWYPYAVRAGRRMIERNRPDVIYASGKPFTSLIVARRLAQRYGIPWVAELRDLWTDNHYRNYSDTRDRLDRWLENRTLGDADGLVTVTEPFAEVLRRRFIKPVAVVTNAYDLHNADLPSADVPMHDDVDLRVVYTGIIYPGKRDPSPLVRALARLGDDAQRIRVEFYGPNMSTALAGPLELASELGVRERIVLNSPVPHDESVSLQREADALLLLTWDHPDEARVFPGKLFEYIGAGRPIIACGSEVGTTSDLIRARALGVSSNDPEVIAATLRGWLSLKQSGQAVPGVDPGRVRDLSRPEQTRKLEAFLRVIARDGT